MSDRHHCQKIAFAISSRNGHQYRHQIVYDSLEGNCKFFCPLHDHMMYSPSLHSCHGRCSHRQLEDLLFGTIVCFFLTSAMTVFIVLWCLIFIMVILLFAYFEEMWSPDLFLQFPHLYKQHGIPKDSLADVGGKPLGNMFPCKDQRWREALCLLEANRLELFRRCCMWMYGCMRTRNPMF